MSIKFGDLLELACLPDINRLLQSLPDLLVPSELVLMMHIKALKKECIGTRVNLDSKLQF